jgi:hypothetical protein
MRLDERRRDDIPQVTEEKNGFLTHDFLEEEVKKAVFQMEHNKSPGSDGFSAKFYQVFWDVIKGDLMTLFHEFHHGPLSLSLSLPLYSLNFGTIIMLPKCAEALKIQQYRHICLLNVSFKIFTKVSTNRLTSIAQSVIQPTQTPFSARLEYHGGRNSAT